MMRRVAGRAGFLALVVAVGAVFHVTSGAAATPVQTFSTVDVDWKGCIGGSAPGGGSLGCGVGSTDDGGIPLATNTVYPSWTVIRVPQGSRLTLPFTFTPNGPGMWQEDVASEIAACGGTDANGTCLNTGPSSIMGDVTAQLDLLCDAGVTFTAPDVLATAASTPPGSPTWPNSYYVPFTFNRGAASVALGGSGEPVAPSPLAYMPHVSPQPHNDAAASPPVATPNAWSFTSIDSGLLTQIWLFGTGGFPLPSPTTLAFSRYETNAGYAGGAHALDVSVALFTGDPKTPPTNDYACLDSPQNSVAGSAFLKTPALAGIYPRWTVFTSAADFRDGSVDRILDMQCVDIGSVLDTHGGTLHDGDHDCLPAALDLANAPGNTVVDPSDATSDTDSDGVPDGIEVANGSNPNVGNADTDGDGSTDYQEIFEFTDPTVQDTDGDGSKDKHDTGADEDAPLTPATVLDTTADDNCPAVANPSQANSDSGNDLNTKLPNIIQNGDTTNPHQDTLGDSCDPDDDNDGLSDVTETTMQILAHGSPVTYCVAAGTPGAVPPAVTMGTTNPDSDQDLGLDGRECQMTTRPDDPSSAQRMPAGTATVDPDKDQLFAPGYPSNLGNLQAEVQYRTMYINKPGGGSENNPDGDAVCVQTCPPNATSGDNDDDSDNDGIKDGIEVRFYGTDPTNADTDGDGCTDGVEAGDVDGNRTVGAADLGAIANTTFTNPVGPAGIFGNYRNASVNQFTTGPIGVVAPHRVDYDFDRNGSIGAADLGAVAGALVFKSCAASTGSPTSNQRGKTVGQQTKLPTDP